MNIIPRTYSSLDFEAAFTKTKEELRGFAELQGKQNGAEGIPRTKEDLRAYFLTKVETTIQGILDYNQQLHLPVSGMVIAQQIKFAAKDKVASIQTILQNDEHKLQALQAKEKHLAPDLKKRRLREYVHVAVAVLAAFEGFFIYEALRFTSFSTLAAISTSAGCAVALAFGAHFLAGYVCRAKTTIQRRIRLAIVLVLFFIFFYIIGCIRAAAYNNNVVDVAIRSSHDIAVQTTGGISPWAITILSFFLLAITLYLSMRVWKSEAEEQKDEAFTRVVNEKTALMGEMEGKRNQMVTIEREANKQAAEALAIYEYAIAAEHRLVSLAKQAFDIYREANLRFRPNKDCPSFFSAPPPFSFRFFFDNVKTDAA